MSHHGNYFSDGEHEWDEATLWEWAKQPGHTRGFLDPRKLVQETGAFEDWDPLTSFAEAVHYFKRVMMADLQYPILLTPEGYVCDGYHRVAQAIVMSHHRMPYIKLTDMPKPDREAPRATNDQLAKEVEDWESGKIKPTDPDWYDAPEAIPRRAP